MKKIIIIFAMLIFAGAKIQAQNVSPIVVVNEGERHNNAYDKNQNFVINAYDELSDYHNDVIKIFNTNDNSMRSHLIEPNATGANIGVETFAVAITETGIGYAFYTYKTRADNVVEYRVDRLNIDGTSETLLSFGDGGPQIAKHLDGVLYFVLGNGTYGFDPESSGLPIFNNYLFVAFETSTNTILWTKMLTEEVNQITPMPDGNLFVTTNNGYKKINAADGSLMNEDGCANSDAFYYDSHEDNILCVNNTSHVTKVKEWDGSVSSETNFAYNHYGFPLSKFISLGDKHLAFSGLGMGKYVEFRKDQNDKSLNMIHQRCYETLTIPADATSGSQFFSIGKPLEMQETYFIGIAKNEFASTKNFFGMNVPGGSYVIYKLTFNTNPGQYISLNDISGTHNIVQVEADSFFDDGNYVSTDANVGYVIFDSTSNIPAVGTIIPESWNLWNMNGGLIFIDAAGIHEVKVDAYGRKYFDIGAYDPNGDTSNPLSKDYFNYRVYCVAQNTAGISDQEISKIKIFPNPVQDVLHIRSGNRNISKIEIRNIIGQKMFKQNYTYHNKIKINISKFPNGIYFIKILNDKRNTSIVRLIKK